MTKRDVVKTALASKRPPYVPWSFGFTQEAQAKLKKHYGCDNIGPYLQNHLQAFENAIGRFEEIGDNRFKDYFGVTWDRSEDKDIGVVEGTILSAPTLSNYEFPEPTPSEFFSGIEQAISQESDLFRVFSIGFSLFERAWTLRGMENLLMDFYENPSFVKELLRHITDFNIAQVKEAVKYDIDAVYFGDDWGQQHGLIMGPAIWKEFIYPELKRMYAIVKDAGKHVFIHSCGDVDELFDDLIDIGLDCFNPFQPEVMDVDALMIRYKGKLSFHGGLSTQQILPYGSPEDVIKATRHLLELGADGNYIFAPAHAVEGDVPLENMLAFIETVQGQNK